MSRIPCASLSRPATISLAHATLIHAGEVRRAVTWRHALDFGVVLLDAEDVGAAGGKQGAAETSAKESFVRT
jgi:hypothetical protein